MSPLAILVGSVLIALGLAILIVALLGSIADAAARSKGNTSPGLSLWVPAVGLLVLAAGAWALFGAA